MKKSDKYENFFLWFWRRALFYVRARKLSRRPYRYYQAQDFIKEKWKYLLTLGWIDLEKVVVGEITTEDVFVPINQWDTSSRYLLKNSVFVEFLKLYGGKDTINEEEFYKTSYYQYLSHHLKINRKYRDITDPLTLIEQANYFLKLYHSILNGSYTKKYSVFCKTGEERSFEKYPCIVKLNDGYWGIRDGHHRLAALYCFKKRWALVHIVLENNKKIWSYKEI